VANTRTANSWYVDTQYVSATDDLAEANVAVSYVSLSATSAAGVLVLSDRVTGNVVIDLRVAVAGSTEVFEFDVNPISFPNGIRVTTLTNAKATLIGRRQSGG
jgi:hypothetical protein